MAARKALINDLVDSGLITRATASALHLDPTALLAVATDVPAQGVAVADVAGTAGATYTATEQAVINENKAQINALLASLRATGVIAT